MSRRHMRWALPVSLLCGLFACSSAPPPPDWQVASARAIEQAVDAHLSGQDRVARAEFARAQAEVRRSADPDAVARVYLMRCAAQVAALEFVDCAQPPGWRDAAPSTQAYARHLMAQAQPADLALLPEAQRKVMSRDDVAAQVQAVLDTPAAWSRLVAAGVLWRRGQRDPALAQVAVDTASAQGWSRALGQWLVAWQAALSAAGQTEAAARAQRRLELLLNSPAAAKPPN